MTASVVDVLEDQHRRVAGLFEKVGDPDEDRPAVLRAILRDLAAHVAVERSTVLPVVRDRDLGDGVADRLKDDYDRIERLMVLIERRKFNSPDLPDLVGELKGVVDAHTERARRDLLPGLRRTLSAEEQADLGRSVEDGDGLVTSHPHPHLLSLGPIADVVTRAAERWDRARDRTAVNRQHPEDEGKRHVTRVARTWSRARGNQPGEGSGPEGDGRSAGGAR